MQTPELQQANEIEVDNTGLKVVQELDYETWAEYIQQALQRRTEALDYVERVSLWIIGDLYIYGEDHFGEDEAVQIADQYSAETIRKARWVARNIPRDQRDPYLSFSHHEVVVKKEPEERKALLEYARDKELSVYELRKHIRKEPKGPGSGKAGGNPPQGSSSDKKQDDTPSDPPAEETEDRTEHEMGKCPFCGERSVLSSFREF